MLFNLRYPVVVRHPCIRRCCYISLIKPGHSCLNENPGKRRFTPDRTREYDFKTGFESLSLKMGLVLTPHLCCFFLMRDKGTNNTETM